jgi:murein DD-endopeptidase MepM/ murein hydrolase activator NlpD
VPTRAISVWRTYAVAALVIAMCVALAVPAQARPPLQTYRAQKHRLVVDLARTRSQHHGVVKRWTAVIERSNDVLRHGPGRGGMANLGRWKHLQRHLRHARWVAKIHVHRSQRRTLRQVQALGAERASVQAWIDTWGIFEVCPIQGWNEVVDNFGITVRLPRVPVHRHMGNDVLALTGTPIVAPFDGFATASTGELGGMEVRVHGELGYVYNAHLSRFGTLGTVQTGDIIGFVGSTGDATTPHDHIEWHPDDGVAVDPYPYLSASCG